MLFFACRGTCMQYAWELAVGCSFAVLAAAVLLMPVPPESTLQ
jgi:hypothetical protein